VPVQRRLLKLFALPFFANEYVIIMPRAFPSQITGYLAATFKQPESLNHATVHSYIGAVEGFLDLYKQLPDELIRLSPEDHAALVTAIGTIRIGTDQFRQTSNPESLRPVGGALGNAWRLIATLKDEAASTSHDLTFITDAVLQEMIGLDLSAVATDLQSGEWKGATIIAGSCCEALLLYGLQTTETKKQGTIAGAVSALTWPSKPPKASDLTDRSWDLFSYTEVAHQTGLISDSTKAELTLARNYRNLIHPAKTVREQVRCDRGPPISPLGRLSIWSLICGKICKLRQHRAEDGMIAYVMRPAVHCSRRAPDEHRNLQDRPDRQPHHCSG
jgi:hypothetical protein